MTERHLGDRIHDLVDGRLSRAETVAAMEHLENCAACADERAAILRDRLALQTSGQGIDVSSVASLLDRDRIAERAKAEPRRHLRAATGHGRSAARLAAIVGAGALTGLAGLYTLGAPETARLEYASTTTVAGDSYEYLNAAGMRSSDTLKSWIHPNWKDSGLVPIDARLVRTSDGVNFLHATVLAGLETVVIFEQHGELPSGIESTYDPARHTEREAYVVASESPAHIVFESGNAVVSVVCDCPLDILEDVVDEFPDDEDPGFLERIGNGLDVVTSAVAGN